MFGTRTSVSGLGRAYVVMRAARKARAIGQDPATARLETRAELNRRDVARIRRNDQVRQAAATGGSIGTGGASARRNDALGF